jgi:hypothetical protein
LVWTGTAEDDAGFADFQDFANDISPGRNGDGPALGGRDGGDKCGAVIAAAIAFGSEVSNIRDDRGVWNGFLATGVSRV